MTSGSGNSAIPERSKVLVAMSGGVDSSVAAALLKEQGHEVVGCFMRLGTQESFETRDGCAVGESGTGNRKSGVGASTPPGRATPNAGTGSPDPRAGDRHRGCCSVADASDARLVAAMLDIPLYVMNFRRDFDRVIDYFVAEYNAGRTPNPCVRCNDWLKFGKLHDYARGIDCDYIASGHYARVDRAGRSVRLLRGLDGHKDQSYVLFGCPRERLEQMVLPIGGYHKEQVRRIAGRMGLPVFDKPDSQEICFVPDDDYASLVRRRTPGGLHDGDVVDGAGRVVGRHGGHQRMTIGQRRGVGVALGYPVYVVDKDPGANTVTVGRREDLLSIGCRADQVNWLEPGGGPPAQWRRCTVKARYNSEPAPARVRADGSGAIEVRFDARLSAVSPGQAVVGYDDQAVIGGGWITQAVRDEG